MARSKGRTGRPYRRARERTKALPGADVCWLCGRGINMALPPNHRMAWTADHVIPITRDGAEVDPANLRPAHRSCNSTKGNRAARPQLQTSRRW
jgi:5-methylcytosine-specific restriction endonuclease McrA